MDKSKSSKNSTFKDAEKIIFDSYHAFCYDNYDLARLDHCIIPSLFHTIK